ncbi:MAG TPA: cytochrome c oxidase assembly protein [Pseudonocardiaceae bacterium]|nr:cytochrome c oxidase assembly protein [Pseudonocardiaceae bacterium]
MDMPGMGSTALPPLTLGSALGTWHLVPVADVIVALAALGYLHRAYRTLPRAGVRWPAGRTASFLGALLVAAVAVQSGIDVYGGTLFWMHMVEHLVLIMVVPALFILGQPIRLLSTGADKSGADTIATRTESALRSRVASVLTFPLVGLALYAAILVGTHLTGFMQQMLTHLWLHDLEIALYLVGGYLYFLPLLGHEPLRRELSYPLRVFVLLMGMTADTVVGVMLMMASSEPFPAYAAQNRGWGPGLLSDIHTGGGIMWVIGDGLMFAITVLVVAQWMGDTERQNDTGRWLESARRSSLAGLGVDLRDESAEPGKSTVDNQGAGGPADQIDNDDEALAAYNRMLARLSQLDKDQPAR